MCVAVFLGDVSSSRRFGYEGSWIALAFEEMRAQKAQKLEHVFDYLRGSLLIVLLIRVDEMCLTTFDLRIARRDG